MNKFILATILAVIILFFLFPTIYCVEEIKNSKICEKLISLINSKQIYQKLDESFLYGVSSSSYQNEGGNDNSDWAEWEKKNVNLPCGKSSNGWEMMEDDLEKLISLGVNCYRFSVEWSRLMPEKGVWDESVAFQYKNFVKNLNKNNITPFCTLLHFTLPKWLDNGLESDSFVKDFLDFTNRVSELFGNEVKHYLTLNEPMLWLIHSYIRGTRPPCKKSNLSFEKAIKNMFKAHEKAYQQLHKYNSNIKVSISQNIVKYSPKNTWNIMDNVVCYFVNKASNYSLLDAFSTGKLNIWFPNGINIKYSSDNIKSLDFIGINHYNDALVRFSKTEIVDIILNHGDFTKSDMDWSFVPNSLYNVCTDVYKKYKMPLYITENGYAGKDIDRELFLKYSKATLILLRQEKIPIYSYLYWTFYDNWEWEEGRKNFGLYETNYSQLDSNEKRLIPRKSVTTFKNLFNKSNIFYPYEFTNSSELCNKI